MPEEAVEAAEAAEAQAGIEEVKETSAEAVAEPETPVETVEAPAEKKIETAATAPAVEEPVQEEAPAYTEDVSYQAVEKEGSVTAIWEMQGQKHLRTIDPRSHEGKQILALFETAG